MSVDAVGIDFSPVLRVMLMGITVAVGPLFWVWLRSRRLSPVQRLRALTLLTLFLTFDLVLFGAFTRLTDSGLGCPDWPGCYGHASPLGAGTAIAQAQEVMPTGPVTYSKAWIEMLHRYMATGVGVLVVTMVVARIAERKHGASLPSLWWSVATLVAVCAQGAFGALTVTMKLFPAIVTLHLLGALLLLALLAALGSRYDPRQPMHTKRVAPMSVAMVAYMVVLSLLLVLQIALGGWVSTNYAVLACQDFPTCHSSWWPDMNFQQGFTLWRELGMTDRGTPIAFSALTAIHYTHRLMAYGVLIALAAAACLLHRTVGLQRQAKALGGLAALQLLTGLSNVVFGWPLVAALAHTGGAAALVIVMVWILSSCTTNFTHAMHGGSQHTRVTA
jgi:heme a synthase